MNIEALDAALIKKQEISGGSVDDTTNPTGTTAAKEASSTSSGSKFAWMDEFLSLISGKTDETSSLSGGASELGFTRSGGWRSGNFSFLTGLGTSSNPNSVTGRYSDLKSFKTDTVDSYSSRTGELKTTLENQLIEAKNKLAKLEAEQKAKQIELDSGYDSTTGKKLKKKGREALQNTINSYSTQIILQKTTISNIESKLERIKE